MERGNEWSKRIAGVVGDRVAHFRSRAKVGERGLTVQALADRCNKLGLPLGRPAISKLENGLRHSITVDEVMILSQALGVAPSLLLFPLGHAESAEVSPGQFVDPWDAVLWFSGLAERPELPVGGTSVVELYQVHAQLAARPLPAGGAPGAEDALSRAQSAARELMLSSLRQVRAIMRERDLIPPKLTAELAGALGEMAVRFDG